MRLCCFNLFPAAVSLLTINQKLPTPTYQVLLYPVLDLLNEYPSASEFQSGYLLEWEAMGWFSDNYLGQSGDRSNPCISLDE